MSFHIKDVSEFNQKLTEAGEKLVIVDFYATWCAPCKRIAPKLDDLANLYAENLLILKVNVEELEELVHKYNISSMPTFVFIKKEQTLDTFLGSNYDKLLDTINKHRSGSSDTSTSTTEPFVRSRKTSESESKGTDEPTQPEDKSDEVASKREPQDSLKSPEAAAPPADKASESV